MIFEDYLAEQAALDPDRSALRPHNMALFRVVEPHYVQPGKERPCDVYVSSDGGATWAIIPTVGTGVEKNTDAGGFGINVTIPSICDSQMWRVEYGGVTA